MNKEFFEAVQMLEKEKGIPAEDVTTCKHVLYHVLQNLIEKHKEEGNE